MGGHGALHSVPPHGNKKPPNKGQYANFILHEMALVISCESKKSKWWNHITTRVQSHNTHYADNTQRQCIDYQCI